VTILTAGLQGPQGITEGDIAEYLAQTPGFFERQAELLASIQLTSPHGQRAVSLQERQMEMLRERIKGLERKIVEMIRHGQENMALADRLHRWTLTALGTANPRLLPAALVDELQRQFMIPQAALRLWSLGTTYADEGFAAPVSEDVKSLAGSLAQPYCGLNTGFEATQWLEAATSVTSVALVPLRATALDAEPYGLLVLGSPDPTRYSADMGTEFQVRIGELAGAALARLRAPV
jgi:uncharacterized protein YigA (DUF484 family)